MSRPLPDLELVLTRAELAAALKVSLRTVDKLTIPSLRIGKRRLYRVEDVKTFLQEKVA